MNLLLLFPEDFVTSSRARITGRRFLHVATVLRGAIGSELTVGVAGGKIGRGVITQASAGEIEIEIDVRDDPPPPSLATIILAMPRPKVLNRVVAAMTSMGVKRIFLINAWRVEKSYWRTPRLSDDNLLAQRILGLEQARDTILPTIELRRLFRPFVEQELPGLIAGTRALVAHPDASTDCPRNLQVPVTLAVGPEGGFIEQELESLARIGFEAVSLGPRPLRVETVLPAILGRLL